MSRTKSFRTQHIINFVFSQIFLDVSISHFTLGQDLKTAIFSEANSAMKEAQNV